MAGELEAVAGSRLITDNLAAAPREDTPAAATLLDGDQDDRNIAGAVAKRARPSAQVGEPTMKAPQRSISPRRRSNRSLRW